MTTVQVVMKCKALHLAHKMQRLSGLAAHVYTGTDNLMGYHWFYHTNIFNLASQLRCSSTVDRVVPIQATLCSSPSSNSGLMDLIPAVLGPHPHSPSDCISLSPIWTVPPWCSLFSGNVPPWCELGGGTVPPNSFFLYFI